MQSLEYNGLKITNTSQSFIGDQLVVEAPLQISINNSPYTVVMRTPGDDLELIRGLLYAEDIYKKNLPLNYKPVKFNDRIPTTINVTIDKDHLGKGYLSKRTLLSVSSCGICGKQKLEDLHVNPEAVLSNKNQFSSEHLFQMFNQLKDYQEVFKKTGGSHAAGIFDKEYKLLSIKEDIGRHNAVDKCVGDLLNRDNLKSSGYLLVSGRVSYEIVTKAFLAKIPTIVAVSACSSMAVDYAKEFGICLIGFTRENKMTVYSNPTQLKTV